MCPQRSLEDESACAQHQRPWVGTSCQTLTATQGWSVTNRLLHLSDSALSVAGHLVVNEPNASAVMI